MRLSKSVFFLDQCSPFKISSDHNPKLLPSFKNQKQIPPIMRANENATRALCGGYYPFFIS